MFRSDGRPPPLARV